MNVTSDFVQCDNDLFYQRPQWNDRTAMLIKDQLFVVGPRTVDGARKRGREFLRIRGIKARIIDCIPALQIFPGSPAMQQCFEMGVIFESAPPVPDESTLCIASVSVEDFDHAFIFKFDTGDVWDAMNGFDIDLHLASFIMCHRIYQSDIHRYKRRVVNRLRKQFPDIKGGDKVEVLTKYGPSIRVAKGKLE